MNRNNSIIIGLVVLIVVVGGGFLLFHKSSTPASNTTKSSQSSSAPDVNNAVLVTKTDSQLGKYLTDPNGKPLYTYGGDTSGVSNCTGACLSSWPAYTASGSTSGLPTGVSTIKRSDNGQTQYTYNGMPLYYFVSDTAGKAPTGNGQANFAIATPAASSSTSTSTSTSTPSSSSSSTTNTNSSSSNYNY